MRSGGRPRGLGVLPQDEFLRPETPAPPSPGGAVPPRGRAGCGPRQSLAKWGPHGRSPTRLQVLTVSTLGGVTGGKETHVLLFYLVPESDFVFSPPRRASEGEAGR